MSRRRDPSGIEIVTADDTNVSETDDKSLYDDEEEDVSWLEQDTMDDDEALLVTVNDDTDDEDDNVEVPETKFGYEEWINHEADDDDKMDGDDIVNVDAENLVTVYELVADQIQKKVQMKIEPMNKVAATTDCYKNEITELQRKNVVTFRKLKRNRAERSNLLVPKEETRRTVSGDGGEGNCATKEAGGIAEITGTPLLATVPIK